MRPREALKNPSTWLMVLPVFASILFMAPRLASAQFGLLDDGMMLVKSAQVNAGIWDFQFDTHSGRSRPLYWLYSAFIYRFFGQQAFWFFLGNLVLLAAMVFLIIYLVRACGGSRLQAGLSGFFYLTASPVVENYYTLGKGEPLQLLLLAISLALIVNYRRAASLWARTAWVIGMAAAIFLAACVKETGILIVPISVAWLVLGGLNLWLSRRSKTGIENVPAGSISARLAYCLAAVLGAASFYLYRSLWISSGINGGSYTNGYSFSVASIITSIIRWSGWLIRDFGWLAPIAMVMLVWYLFKRQVPQLSLLLDVLVWMALWIGVYLPWTYAVDYYLLPFAAGTSILAGLLVSQAVERMRDGPASRYAGRWAGWRAAMGVSLALAAMLFIAAMGTNLSNMRVQLVIDRTNAEMLQQLAEIAPPGGAVLVNIQYMNEYVSEIRIYLNQVLGRPDITLDMVNMEALDPAAQGSAPALIVSPILENQPALTVRMGQAESTQAQWNKSLYEALKGSWKQVFQNTTKFTLTSLDQVRLLCPVAKSIDYCATGLPVLDTRTFTYGWEIYQLELP